MAYVVVARRGLGVPSFDRHDVINKSDSMATLQARNHAVDPLKSDEVLSDQVET